MIVQLKFQANKEKSNSNDHFSSWELVSKQSYKANIENYDFNVNRDIYFEPSRSHKNEVKVA